MTIESRIVKLVEQIKDKRTLLKIYAIVKRFADKAKPKISKKPLDK